MSGLGSARWWYRYYFVRRKAPLSYILWYDILRRRSEGASSLTDEWTDLRVDERRGTVDFDVLREDESLFQRFRVRIGRRAARRLSVVLDELWSASADDEDVAAAGERLWTGVVVSPEPGGSRLEAALLGDGRDVARADVRIGYRSACRLADIACPLWGAQRRAYHADEAASA